MNRSANLEEWLRRERLLLSILAATGALATLAGVLGWPAASIAVLAIGGLGAAAQIAFTWRRGEIERRDEEAEMDRRVRAAIAPVRSIEATQIGVDPAAQEMLPGGDLPEYVPRRIDVEVRDALASGLDGDGSWIVVVCGPSKVGKSRTLFEALRVLCDEGRELSLIAPASADAVRSLLSSGRIAPDGGSQPVLWLDDLEVFVADGVTLDTLKEWHEMTGALVAATLGGKGRDRVRNEHGKELTALTRDILSSAREIGLDATSAVELEQLPAGLSRADRKNIEDFGLAATMVAAPALERKLATRQHETGEAESFGGEAAVLAAVDWARCGRTDPISAEQLRELWPAYLPIGVAADDDAFADGLDWALRPVAGRIALLVPGQLYRPYDYIVRSISDRPDVKDPLEQAWAAALDTSEPGQAFAVGARAYAKDRHGDSMAAMEIARRSDDQGLANAARSNIGYLLQVMGDFEAAEAAYRQAIELGSGKAAANLGRMLQERGDADGAIAAYRQAMAFEHGGGASSYGVLLMEKGDMTGAEAAYRKAIELGSGSGASNLGLLLEKRGDIEGAIAAYRQAMELGDGFGASKLGIKLLKEGDADGAEAAYRRAIELGSGPGAYNLGHLKHQMGDLDAAKDAYLEAIELGHIEGASNLGVLLEEEGDVEGAAIAFHQAMEGNIGVGAYNLGLLLQAGGEFDRARQAFQRATESDDARIASQAEAALGRLPGQPRG